MPALQIAVALSSLWRARTSFNTGGNFAKHFLFRLNSLPCYTSELAAAGVVSSKRPVRGYRSFALQSVLSTMADNKSRKQATLGYVRDSQATIGCVNGLLTEGIHCLRVGKTVLKQFADSLPFPLQEIFRSRCQWKSGIQETDDIVLWWEEAKTKQ